MTGLIKNQGTDESFFFNLFTLFDFESGDLGCQKAMSTRGCPFGRLGLVKTPNSPLSEDISFPDTEQTLGLLPSGP